MCECVCARALQSVCRQIRTRISPHRGRDCSRLRFTARLTDRVLARKSSPPLFGFVCCTSRRPAFPPHPYDSTVVGIPIHVYIPKYTYRPVLRLIAESTCLQKNTRVPTVFGPKHVSLPSYSTLTYNIILQYVWTNPCVD